MDTVLKKVVAENEAFGKVNKGDYYDENGRLFCGKCGEPKQTSRPITLLGRTKRMFIPCACDRAEERVRRRVAMQKFQDKVRRLRRQGLTDKAYESCTFEKDDGRNPDVVGLCRNYVRHWEEMRRQSAGILFYGDTGGGKSFYACCIANALLSLGVSVLVTRLSLLVRNRNDPQQPDIDLRQFDFIVLDDVGVENATPTAFSVINDIYLADIPLAVTTNLTPSEFKALTDLERRRIYDRIIERCCLKCEVKTTKTRLEMAKEKERQARAILES